MNAPNELCAGLLMWISVTDHMPDDDETVLLYAPEASEPVWVGYHDADVWRYVDGMEATGVTHWLPMPSGPQS